MTTAKTAVYFSSRYALLRGGPCVPSLASDDPIKEKKREV